MSTSLPAAPAAAVMPLEADFPSTWAYVTAFGAYLNSIHDHYDRSLPYQARLAFGTAECPRCHRLSRGAFGCTAGC